MNEKIILIGFMGSGKTTIGKALSVKLSIPFVDLDQYIEEREALSISEIFDQYGEYYFRKKERQALLEILKRDEAAIISTGGGTVCFYDHMDLINNNSKNNFFLSVSPEIIAERLEKEKANRPLVSRLKYKELQVFVNNLLEKRLTYYQQAKHTIDGNKSSTEIVDKILSIYNQKEL